MSERRKVMIMDASSTQVPEAVGTGRFSGVVDRLLPVAEVEAAVGLSTSSIYRRIAAGTFPRPRRLSPACVRWRLSELNAWIEALPEAADDTPADRAAS